MHDSESEKIEDIAYTLQVGRTAFKYRRSFSCKSKAEALEALTPENVALRRPSTSGTTRPLVSLHVFRTGSTICRDV